MSTALFLNIDKKINRNDLRTISKIYKNRNITDIALCYLGQYENVKGKTYCFDSMWVPFLKPLVDFEENTENYNEFKEVFRADLEIIKFLQDKGYEVRLFLNSIGESRLVMHDKTTIAETELNERTSLAWATIYTLSGTRCYCYEKEEKNYKQCYDRVYKKLK